MARVLARGKDLEMRRWKNSRQEDRQQHQMNQVHKVVSDGHRMAWCSHLDHVLEVGMVGMMRGAWENTVDGGWTNED